MRTQPFGYRTASFAERYFQTTCEHCERSTQLKVRLRCKYRGAVVGKNKTCNHRKVRTLIGGVKWLKEEPSE